MKYDLKNCTFIIPVKIESDDRARNCKIVIDYLRHNFDCRISILEAGSKKIENILDMSGLHYKHVELGENNPFHKTKYLNMMAREVNTPIVCCYDIDVILPVDTYQKSVELIEEGFCDAVYPYGFGVFQKKIYLPYDNVTILDSKDLECFRYDKHLSMYGHCNFASMNAYKKIGYENENFISYGPEDEEKHYRYNRLGFKVGRIDNLIYHIEHSIGKDSSEENPFYAENVLLFDKVKQMSDVDFVDYCDKLNNENNQIK